MNEFRALDIVESRSHDWESFNTIFGYHTSIMDDLFNRGVRTDMSTYVPNKSNYEQQFCEIQLNPVRKSGTHRIHVLKGKIGRGKSTFIDYCRLKVLPSLYKEDLLTLLYNATSEEDENLYYEFEYDIIRLLELQVKEIVFKSDQDMFNEYCKFMGATIKDDVSAVAYYDTSKNLNRIFRFVNHLVKSSKFRIKGLLLIVDNIDENSKEIIKKADRYLKDIIKVANNVIDQFPLTILVSVRDYNAKAYFYTDKNSNSDLRNVEEHEVVFNKIKALKNGIDINSNHPDFIEPFDYNIMVDGYYSTDSKRVKSVTSIIAIESGDIVNFLDSFAEQLFNSSDTKTIKLLAKLSGGNLKVLVANVFNILHSNKLPLSKLFKKHFTPDEAKKYTEVEEPFDEKTVLECLMSIHYPFYTVQESQIMNLYNCNSIKGESNMFDKLVLLKVILGLKNLGGTTFNRLSRELNRYGYSLNLIELAIKKCLNYGIIHSAYGVKISHFDKEKTILELSSIGDLYISNFLTNINYYQYACEDVYLPKRYYVDLKKKYPSNNHYGKKRERLKSAKNLAIHLVELLEREEAHTRKKFGDLEALTDVFGYPTITKNIPVKDMLQGVIHYSS